MGRVDGVIANAGMMSNAGTFLDMTTEEWRRLLAVNQDGAFVTVREGARHMKRRFDAGDPGGSLLFCASLSALTGSPGMQHYNASKGAMVAMSRGIAVEAGRYGIRCNVVCPGYTASDTVQIAPDDPLFDHIRRYSPMGRMGTPDDFEGIGVYFMSECSRFHTGDLVDGRGWMDGERREDRHLGAAAVAVNVLRVEGMRDDTRTDDERRALEAAEAQPLDMRVDAVLDAARRAERVRRLRPPRLRRTPRSAARRGRGRRQRVERAQVDVRGPLHQGRGQPPADPAPLVGAPRSAGRHHRAADRRDRVATVGEHPPREPGGRRPPAPPPPGLRGRATGADPGGRARTRRDRSALEAGRRPMADDATERDHGGDARALARPRVR